MRNNIWQVPLIVGVMFFVLSVGWMIKPVDSGAAPQTIVQPIEILSGRTPNPINGSNTYTQENTFTVTTTFSDDIAPSENSVSRLGLFGQAFRDFFVSSTAWFHEGIRLEANVPSDTTNGLYNNAGTLTFNGSAVGGGGAAATNLPPWMSSTTYANAAGAVHASGTVRLASAPSGGEGYSESFIISNGATSTLFTHANGSGHVFAAGHTTIDIGGGTNGTTYMLRVMDAISRTDSLKIIAKCDSYPIIYDAGAFGHVNGCLTWDGTTGLATTTMFRLYNTDPGSLGNVSITDNTVLLDFGGMAGGAN